MIVNYGSALIYMVLTMMVTGGILFLSSRVGPKRSTAQKMMPYECGMDPSGSLEVRFPIRFYVVAMVFIIFDIETVFLYPWATVFLDLGWFGFVEMFLFTILLLLGLVYLYRKGALEWE